MAFSYTVDKVSEKEGMAHVFGTFTNSSSAGGDINTGLTVVFSFLIQHTGSSVVSNQPVVNETIATTGNVALRGSIPGKALTIVTDTDKSGIWYAIGIR